MEKLGANSSNLDLEFFVFVFFLLVVVDNDKEMEVWPFGRLHAYFCVASKLNCPILKILYTSVRINVFFSCPVGGAVQQNGQTTAEIQEEVALTNVGTTAAAEKRNSSNDKLHFPRADLQTITTLGKCLLLTLPVSQSFNVFNVIAIGLVQCQIAVI